MATSQSTVEFLMDQVASAGDVRIRKMFGEYALYCDNKVVALICDDKLYVKPTNIGKSFLGSVTEAPPYPGSKPFFYIDEEYWENREWLTELIEKTAEEVPVIKKKRR